MQGASATAYRRSKKSFLQGWTKAFASAIIAYAECANVAQSVEQLIRNQQVRGPSPLIGSSDEV